MVFARYYTMTGLPTPVFTLTTFAYAGIVFFTAGIVTNQDAPRHLVRMMRSRHFWITAILSPWFLLHYFRATSYVHATIAETLTAFGPLVVYGVVKVVYRDPLRWSDAVAGIAMAAAAYLLAFGFSAPAGIDRNLLAAVKTVGIGIVIAAFAKASQKHVPVPDTLAGAALFLGTYFCVACVSLLPAVADLRPLLVLDWRRHGLLAVSSLLEGSVWFFVFLCTRFLDAYRASLLHNLSCLFTLAFDFVFLGTVLTAADYLAVVLLVAGLQVVVR
ncbi:MAG: hypothetical protein KatS3mg082_1409 [Nitrospiraceae bacterium]|nr:MAG: hypothetical protein KatS3mg082_1409 [Nitrospiraceae bacterium]